MDRIIRGLIRNIEDDWKEIRDVGKKCRREEYQKKFRKKKNKKQRDQGQKSRMKKMKQATYKTYTINCKVLRMRTFKRGVLL